MTKTVPLFAFIHVMILFLSFEFWSFDIVSYFEIRILVLQCATQFDIFFCRKMQKIYF